MKTVYIIEEGMKSPRDSSIGWRYWGGFVDKSAAIRQAKKLPIARVLESRQIYMTTGLEVLAALPTRTPR